MGRKSSGKKMRWFESYQAGAKELSARHYLDIMTWACSRGLRVASRYRPIREPGRGVITFMSYGEPDVRINRHRINLYKRVAITQRQRKPAMFQHKIAGRLPLSMVICHPHVERDIRKTSPRGQAFDRIMKMDIEHA